MMSLTRGCVAVFVGGVLLASATLAESQGAPQGAPATAAPPAAQPPRPPTPTRDPRTPGYVTATSATELPDGAVPPVDDVRQLHPRSHASAGSRDDRQRRRAPRHRPRRSRWSRPRARSIPGIARTPGTRATVDPADPAKRIVSSGPAPYSRRVAVYIPQQYVPGTVAPVHRRGRRNRSTALHGPRQSDRAEARSGDDCDFDRQWQR